MGALTNIGAGVVALWIFVALAAPVLAPFEPNALLSPFATPGAPGPDDGTFWLGTDHLGRDILSRIIWGARSVLTYAPVAAFCAYVLGVTMGLAAGYFKGWVDAGLSFVSNAVLAFPVLVLYILVITTIGASALNIVLAVTFASAPGIMRIVRSLVLDLRNRGYVAAAETRGVVDFIRGNFAQRAWSTYRRRLPAVGISHHYHWRSGFSGIGVTAARPRLGWYDQ